MLVVGSASSELQKLLCRSGRRTSLLGLQLRRPCALRPAGQAGLEHESSLCAASSSQLRHRSQHVKDAAAAGDVAWMSQTFETAPKKRHRKMLRTPGRGPGELPYEPTATGNLVHKPSSPSATEGTNIPAGELFPDDLGFDFAESTNRGGGGALNDQDGAQRHHAATAAAGALHGRLSRARSLGQLLQVLADDLPGMDTVHMATALHRLARLAPRGKHGPGDLVRRPVVDRLMKRFESTGAAGKLSVQGACCVLWAVARLQTSPPWLPELLKHLSSLASNFSSHALATCFYALSKMQSMPATQESQAALLEVLHEELRRRKALLGPGGASAVDVALLADALSKLQIRDGELFGSLAAALLQHLNAGALEIREVRHVTTAFAAIGFVDAKLTAAVCDWLRGCVGACNNEDLVALSMALARTGGVAGAAQRRFFDALRADVLDRLQRGEIHSRDAGCLLYAFSEAAASDVTLARRLVDAIAKAPQTLNGQDLSLVVPCLGLDIAQERPELVEALAAQAAVCSKMLSPRQLARLAVGFGEARAASPALWKALGSDSLSRASFFAAPDVVRMLAGLDAAAVDHDGAVLNALWTAVHTKLPKLLAEESLALLQLWPRTPDSLRRHHLDLPVNLLENLRTRMERATRGSWRAPADLTIEMLEWLPESRQFDRKGHLDAGLVSATLSQLPAQVAEAPFAVLERLLVALTASDSEVFARSRTAFQTSDELKTSLARRAAQLNKTAFDPEVAVDFAFKCAALGFDGPAMRELLHALHQTVLPDASASEVEMSFVAKLCWSCAEVKTSRRDALRLVSRITAGSAIDSGSDTAGKTQDHPEAIQGLLLADPVHQMRLTWSSLAMSAPESEVNLLVNSIATVVEEDIMERLAPVDLRPARQLAWHMMQQQQQKEGSTKTWAEAVLKRQPWGDSQHHLDKRLSKLLQHLRVPHVSASHLAIPGGVYQVPAWFPAPQAVLDVDSWGDRLSSGGLAGSAQLRRKQLRAAGLRVHTLDAAALQLESKGRRLRAVAQAVSESCPEAARWLVSPEAAAVSAERPEPHGEHAATPRFEEQPPRGRRSEEEY
eukprot:TRINITY_DN49124_c0_g1_i1.p1 TRINITY_DN49124_c0_g1~~TRINITY_DN49124_c0_g1_i1.p1  ORF type:complete len:1072 (-),score=198.14 TRINITY_DN49124_c0_g1_i1:53-3268(-)